MKISNKLLTLTFTFIVALTPALISSSECRAQKFALSTNLAEWAYYGTANLDASLSVSQHFSVFVGGHYNQWKFAANSDNPVFNNQTSAYAGVRYWPWYVYSGWWLGARLRYTDFSRLGFFLPTFKEGRSVGAGVSFGYTWMIHEKFNIEVGGGIWGGRHLQYAKYWSSDSMDHMEKGPRNFLALEDLSVALMYVF